MKLVLDSNVYVAAFATHGLCHGILEFCLENHEVVLTQQILDEVSRTLRKRLNVAVGTIEEVKRLLISSCELVKPGQVPASVCRDQDDLGILGAAKATDASYIVTGDEDLLVLKAYAGAEIVTPRVFWERVRRGSSET